MTSVASAGLEGRSPLGGWLGAGELRGFGEVEEYSASADDCDEYDEGDEEHEEGLHVWSLREVGRDGEGEVPSAECRVRSDQWEVGSGKWEVGSGKWEVGSGKWEDWGWVMDGSASCPYRWAYVEGSGGLKFDRWGLGVRVW